MILQSLMIDDTDVKRVLKGEIQEPLNALRGLLERFSQIIIELEKTQQISKVEGAEVIGVLLKIKGSMEQIEKQLGRYYHNVPYLLMLSPLVRLGNLNRKEVESICRKVDIMIGRDKLMRVGDEDSFGNANWYDAIHTLIYMAVHESLEGWKMRQVTEEKKNVTTVIQDHSPGVGRKRRFGVF